MIRGREFMEVPGLTAGVGTSVSGLALVAFILPACVALVAAVQDIRSRRISDALTIPAILSGIALHTARSGWDGLLVSLLGAAIGGGFLLIFCLRGGMGLGDVKLMGGIGALVGAPFVLPVLVLTGVAGGVIAAGKLVVRYGKRYHEQNAKLTCAWGGYRVEETCEGSNGGDGPLRDSIPYGVAIAAGTIVSVALLLGTGSSL
jgi:prepilin peptidase CpaA